jgi:DNA-binding winged helix-turn-helix (wHTH) protein
MSNDFYIYTFAQFRIDSKEKILFRNDEKIKLQRRTIEVLLYLLENASEFVEREEILRHVWEGRHVENSNIYVHIHLIRTALGQNEGRLFIESEGDRRFRFVADVTQTSKTQTQTQVITENSGTDAAYQKDSEAVLEASEFTLDAYTFGWRNSLAAAAGAVAACIFLYLGWMSKVNSEIDNYQLVFIIVNSFFYGVISATTLILETAYEFDRYSWNAARMFPSVLLLNSSAMFAGMTRASEFLPDETAKAFFIGFAFLVVGAVLVCSLAYLVLPNIPVTKAKIKTQPALLAFVKNVGFYFFLIYLFFGLFIFCLTYSSSEKYRSILFAAVFFLLWLFLLAFAWMNINIFNSNLKTLEDGKEYSGHGTFVSMSYLRLIFCFVPTFINIVVYFFSIK